MRIGIITRPNYRNTGIETFEQNLCPWLTDNLQNAERVDHHVREWYPLSITIEKLSYGWRMKKKAEKHDRVFIPAQERVLFNPESVEAEVIPYIHDILPVTTMYKKYCNDSLKKRLSGYLSTTMAVRYMKFIANCQHVITGSEHVAQELRERTAFNGETSVIYQGVDDKPVPRINREKDIDLVYIGDVELERKNPEFIHRAMKLAQENGFTTAAVNFTETGLPVDEEWVDIDDKGVSRVLNRSRFYLHPSLQEGFGRGPVEAQRHGAIPLALDIPINHEILGEAGESWVCIEEPEDVIPHLDVGVTEGRREKCRENAERFKWSKTRRQIAEVLGLK